MVAGLFRSGTNLTKWCLQRYFKVKPVFNEWFWKHGVPPTCIQKAIPKKVPVVVVSKDPVSINVSLYRFWRARRPELDVGNSFSDFIRKRFIVYDNSRNCIDPMYYYINPTEYWNQFYFSWLNWREIDDRRAFLKYRDLIADPAESLIKLASCLQLKRRHSDLIVLPSEKIGPTPDAHMYEMEEPVSEADISFIWSRVDPVIAKSLGYDSRN